jgi:hypothetical protein
MDELFAPPGYAWQRISPAYRSMRRLTTLLFVPILFSIPAVAVGLISGLWWISAILWGIAAAIVIFRLSMIDRNWRAATSSGRTISTSPTVFWYATWSRSRTGGCNWSRFSRAR